MLINFDSDGEFDRIMEEIDPSSIPTKYLKSVRIIFHNGKEIELAGDEIINPSPLREDFSWEMIANQFKQVRDVNILIDVEKFQNDVYLNSDAILSKHFKKSIWSKP
jgi:hypothetical protein